MKKNFNELIASMTETIFTHDYFVDFKKVFQRVDDLEYYLNNLNFLLGKENFDEAFIKTFNKDNEIVTVLPILLAIREKNLAIYEDIVIKYDFINIMDVNYYLDFIYKTNLIEIFKDKRIRNLIDYVTGVEVGLDTNARKNRTGNQMERIVLEYVKKVNCVEYLEQADLNKISKNFDVDIDSKLSDVSKNKKYDFVLKRKTDNHLFLIETNYYRSSGSKLNETARSYEKLSNDIKNIEGATFIWITDGYGWLSTKRDLEKAFITIDHLYNIDDLKRNILNKVINNK